MPSWKKVIVSGSDAVLNDITLSGNIANTSGDFTLDVAGDIIFDADGTDVILKDGGTAFGRFKRDSSDFIIKSEANNNDIVFRGQDGGVTITAMTIDMSEGGDVILGGNISGSATSTGSFGRVEAHGGLHIPTVGSQANGILFGDGDTGFYETADDDVYFKRGGNTVFRANTSSQLDFGVSTLFFNTTGGFNIKTGAGAVGTPNYTFRGDTDTGMYRSADNVIGFSAGGALQLEIASNKISGSAASTGSFGHLVIDKDAHIGEDLLADGDVVAYNSSDMRLKNNLQVIGGALDKIDGINGYEFDWNEQSPEWAQERGHDVGVVAQEIQKIHPEIVEERKNGYLGVDYKRLVPLLIQSVKELKAEVEELKKKV